MSATAPQLAPTAPLDEPLVHRLAAIVGEKRVLVLAGELMVYSSDGLPGYTKVPRIAVFPGTRDEVIAVVRALADAGAPLLDQTPRKGAHDCKVAFVHPKHLGGVLAELVEDPHAP